MKETKTEFNYQLFLTTRKYFVMAAGTIIATVIIVLMAAYPQLQQLNKINQQLKTEEVKLEKISKKIVALQQIKVLPQFAKAKKVDEVLPSHKPLLELISGLNSAAGAAQVGLKEFEISPGAIATDSTKLEVNKSTEDYGSLKLSISVGGKLSAVKNFMTIVEQISPMTTITNLTLSRNNIEGEDEPMARADLDISTHFFTKNIESAIESPLPEIGTREEEIFRVIESFEPPAIEQQTQVKGGGLDDLFDVEKLEIN